MCSIYVLKYHYIGKTKVSSMFYLYIFLTCFSLSPQGQSKINDLTQLLMLHSISTAFKSLLRPSEMSSHDKSPADSLASEFFL